MKRTPVADAYHMLSPYNGTRSITAVGNARCEVCILSRILPRHRTTYCPWLKGKGAEANGLLVAVDFVWCQQATVFEDIDIMKMLRYMIRVQENLKYNSLDLLIPEVICDVTRNNADRFHLDYQILAHNAESAHAVADADHTLSPKDATTTTETYLMN